MKKQNKIGTRTVEETVCDMCMMQCSIWYRKSYEEAIREWSMSSVEYGVLKTNFSPGTFLAGYDLASELLTI